MTARTAVPTVDLVRNAATLPFRLMTSVFLVLMWAQPVLVGLFLAGDFSKLSAHAAVGGIVILSAMGLTATAILAWRPGGWPAWPIAVSVAIFLASGIQVGAGYERNLGLHVPLGVVLATAAIGLGAWAWSPRRQRAAIR
jgi:hypothetical protein